MHIFVIFHLNGEPGPIAITGAQGQITDLLIPLPGDTVHHRGVDGKPFTGRVTHRMFSYEMPDGTVVDGVITVSLFIDRMPTQ